MKCYLPIDKEIVELAKQYGAPIVHPSMFRVTSKRTWLIIPKYLLKSICKDCKVTKRSPGEIFRAELNKKLV